MTIDEKAYQYALQQNKGKTFSMADPDECFRYFASCYEAAKAEEQPVEFTMEKLEKIAYEAAAMANKHNDADDFQETEDICVTAARTALYDLLGIEDSTKLPKGLPKRESVSRDAVHRLFNEIDCRISHGAESRGHPEYVHKELKAVLDEGQGRRGSDD